MQEKVAEDWLAESMKSLVVIPAYNEGQNIDKLLNQLRESVSDCDVLVVDDCSSDNTVEVVAGIGVTQINLPCNLGYAFALQTGLRYAVRYKYDAVVAMDGDGQHNPLDIPSLLAPVKRKDADLVIGSRFVGSGDYRPPFGRAMAIKIFSHVVNLLTGQKIYDTSSGFKAMRIAVARALIAAHFVDFHAEAIVYLQRLGFQIIERPVSFSKRVYGQSMYSLASYVAYPTKTLLLALVALWEARHHRTLGKQL